jgi:hypothetical protein
MGCAASKPPPHTAKDVTSKQQLPIPPTKPPPHTAKDVKQWQETWYEADGLKAAMSTGDTLLVDGIWLKEQAVAGNVLPPRQGLPDAAASDLTVVTEKLWDDLQEPFRPPEGRAYITAISYCWANRNHPDEHGEQLQRLRRPLELMVPSWCVVAFFLDWCSLYQGDRTEEQQEAFKRALKAVNLWYAHPLTWVWALTMVPQGVKPYVERGWPCFEKAVGTMIKDSYMFLDLGAAERNVGRARYDAFGKFDDLRESAVAGRAAPLTPSTFHKMLEKLTFTNGADRVFVAEKYTSTFTEIFCSAKRLDFSGLTEIKTFDEHVFLWCHACEFLNLEGCTGLTSLPESLGSMPACTKLDLHGCTGLTSLPESLGNMPACTTLNLTNCTGLTSLPESLGSMPACTELFLQGCTGLTSLPESLNRKKDQLSIILPKHLR